jgi:hypothetical protein
VDRPNGSTINKEHLLQSSAFYFSLVVGFR